MSRRRRYRRGFVRLTVRFSSGDQRPAYPVIWSIAGKTQMPYYLSDTPEEDREYQREGWTEVAEYLREIDPYDRPITAHPLAGSMASGQSPSRNEVTDDGVLDYVMVHTHGLRNGRVVASEVG